MRTLEETNTQRNEFERMSSFLQGKGKEGKKQNEKNKRKKERETIAEK